MALGGLAISPTFGPFTKREELYNDRPAAGGVLDVKPSLFVTVAGFVMREGGRRWP